MPSAMILLAHVVAAVILAVVLSDAERTLFRLLALLAYLATPVQQLARQVERVLAVLASGTGIGPDPVKATQVQHESVVGRLRQLLLRATLGRRGPPVSAVA